MLGNSIFANELCTTMMGMGFTFFIVYLSNTEFRITKDFGHMATTARDNIIPT